MKIVDLIPENKLVFWGHCGEVITTLIIAECGFEDS